MLTDIPDGWAYGPLFEKCSVANGQVDPKKEPFSRLPLIAPNHIESGTGRLLEIETAAEQRAISGKYQVEIGDVVYSKIRPYLRKVWLADRASLCSADMYPIRSGGELDPGFLLAVLLSDEFSSFAESLSARTGIPKINRDELATYKILTPPLPEQRKIAAILSSVDEVIQATQAVIEQTRRVKEGLLQELLTKGIGHTRFKKTPIGEIPEGWEVKRLDEILTVQGGYAFKSADATDNGARWLKIANVSVGEIDWTAQSFLPEEFRTEHNNYVLVADDIVMAMTRPILSGQLKIARISNEDGTPLLNQRVCRLVPTETSFGPFLYQLMQSRHVISTIERLIGGTDPPNLSGGQIGSIEVGVPPLNEQIEIAKCMDSADTAYLESQAISQRLTKTKQGLLQDLLTGKVRVSV